MERHAYFLPRARRGARNSLPAAADVQEPLFRVLIQKS
jgi:hypothetical protein